MTIRTPSNGTVTATPSQFGSTFNNVPILAFCAVALRIMLSRSALSACGISRKQDASSQQSAQTGIPGSMEKVPDAAPPALSHHDWRVGHQGRDMMYYEERHAGGWQRIEIDGEMLTGRAHHVIYFASAERWQKYPGWACHRRDEIIGRIKSEFRPPDYEYQGGAP